MTTSGWQREWTYIQQRANAPRAPALGCSTVSHDRFGFCRGCVRALRDGGPNGADLEIGAWRLLALAPSDAGCVCNIGVQDCPVHPERLWDKERKIEFRKAWDHRCT